MNYKQGAVKLLGARTPLATANWPFKYSDQMYNLSDAPLVYNTVSGRFQPAFEGNASNLSISFPKTEFGKRKSRSRRKRSLIIKKKTINRRRGRRSGKRKRKNKVRFRIRSGTKRYGKKLRKRKLKRKLTGYRR